MLSRPIYWRGQSAESGIGARPQFQLTSYQGKSTKGCQTFPWFPDLIIAPPRNLITGVVNVAVRGVFRNLKGWCPEYFSGVYFQKYSNFSITFFTLNISTIFFTSNWGAGASPLP